MNQRTQEILSWYESDNPGTRTNLARLLNHGKLAGTGRFVILPVDQGFEHGPARSFAPNVLGYNPHYHFELALEAGCNAYAARQLSMGEPAEQRDVIRERFMFHEERVTFWGERDRVLSVRR